MTVSPYVIKIFYTKAAYEAVFSKETIAKIAAWGEISWKMSSSEDYTVTISPIFFDAEKSRQGEYNDYRRPAYACFVTFGYYSYTSQRARERRVKII